MIMWAMHVYNPQTGKSEYRHDEHYTEKFARYLLECNKNCTTVQCQLVRADRPEWRQVKDTK